MTGRHGAEHREIFHDEMLSLMRSASIDIVITDLTMQPLDGIDFVRLLRTSGTARGNNKTILYISLTTGLLVRASDEADQSMSVTIAKADASNHLHYDVDAKSAAEVLLVASSPSLGKHP